MKFIAVKTEDGSKKGNISFYCKMLHVTRQGFYKYLAKAFLKMLDTLGYDVKIVYKKQSSEFCV